MNEKLYAWFSAKCAKRWGTCTYSTPDGRTVECTLVNPDPAYRYLWDDGISLGEVVKMVGGGMRFGVYYFPTGR